MRRPREVDEVESEARASDVTMPARTRVYRHTHTERENYARESTQTHTTEARQKFRVRTQQHSVTCCWRHLISIGEGENRKDMSVSRVT